MPLTLNSDLRPSPALADRAKEFRREMTPTEARLWQCLRARRLGPHFRRQTVLRRFVADFYCHSARLVVEVDGPVHELRPERQGLRDGILAEHGLRVLHFTNTEVVERITWVKACLSRACRERCSGQA